MIIFLKDLSAVYYSTVIYSKSASIHYTKKGSSYMLFVRVEQNQVPVKIRWAGIRKSIYIYIYISPCLGVERYVPWSTFLIRRTIFFPFAIFSSTSRGIKLRFNRKSILTRILIEDTLCVSNLPLPPPCSRRLICRSGHRSRADNRTCWWSWSGRPWVSCSKRVPRSRCLTHISLLPFCSSRSLLLPLPSLLLPCAQRVPSSSSRHFFFITGCFIPSRRQAIPRRADR